jgi:hypothetical protein
MLFNAFIPDISAQASDDEALDVTIQRAIRCNFLGVAGYSACPVISKREAVIHPPVIVPAAERGGLLLNESC